MNILTDLQENVNITVTKRDLVELIEICLNKNLFRQSKQLPEHLNLKQLSEYINYSEPAIYKMIAQAEIPAYKLSGKLLFKKTEIDEWLMQFKQPTIKARIDELNSKRK
jgi:excisionase family DNA binding protein